MGVLFSIESQTNKSIPENFISEMLLFIFNSMPWITYFWVDDILLSVIDINNVKNSDSGTANQTPLIPKYLGKINKNNNRRTKDREIVIIPERCPFPYDISRTAEKILIPENKKLKENKRSPFKDKK